MRKVGGMHVQVGRQVLQSSQRHVLVAVGVATAAVAAAILSFVGGGWGLGVGFQVSAFRV